MIVFCFVFFKLKKDWQNVVLFRFPENGCALSYNFSFLLFLQGKFKCPMGHSVTCVSGNTARCITCIILNSFSCFRLASMGLADMMSPGESKLPIPLKADGKEEGTPQPESKSKVLPFSSARGVGSAFLQLPWCSSHWCRPPLLFPFGFFSSACVHLVHHVCSSPLFPHPLHGVDLKVTSSYGIELMVVGEGRRDKTHRREVLWGWGEGRGLAWF